MLSQYVSVPVLIVKYPPGGSVIMMVRMVQCWMDGMGQAEDRCSVPLSPAATVTTGDDAGCGSELRTAICY